MKKILPFILILSFVLPFFVSFRPLVVKADTSSVSDNFGDALENVYKDAIGSFGIVASPEFWEDTSDSVWDLICQYYAWPFVSKENTLHQLQNNNISVDQALNDTLNYVLVAIEEQLPYYVYHTLPIDKFFTFYDFSNYPYGLGNLPTALNNICSDSDKIYFISQYGRDFNYILNAEVSCVSMNYLENNALVLYDGDFSVFPNYPYQSIVVRSGTAPSFSLNGFLKFFDGFTFVNTSNIDQWQGVTNNFGDEFVQFVKRSVVSTVGPASDDLRFRCGQVNDSTGGFSNDSFCGTSFVSVGGTVELLVFKSGSAYNAFYSGNSKFYRFDSDYDLSKYPGIDYDKLFQIISENLDKASGSLSDQLNSIVNDYLKKEIELLGDIKDSLRDSSGQSWLRRIYNLLDKNLDYKLSDIADILKDLSFEGGSVDLDDTNDILESINTKLLILTGLNIFGPGGEEDPEPTINSVVSILATKMPFCLVTDVLVLLSLFSAEPRTPHFEFPIPFTASGNTFMIDLSFYDDLRPYVIAFFIVLFLILLTSLTIKIFGKLKD